MKKTSINYVLLFCLMSWVLSLFITILVFTRRSQAIEAELQSHMAMYNERRIWIKSIETRLDALITEKQGD